jgi:CRP-like cAMP-binding protein
MIAHALGGHGQKSNSRIIAALSDASRRSLWSGLERLDIARGQVLGGIGEPVSHFYFVEQGLIALIKPMPNGEAVEISATGPEGLIPANAILGIDRMIFESVVQIPGSVLRMSRDELRTKMAHDRELLHLMHGYASVALSKLAQTAACNILHSVQERCCRWLLMAHDSALGGTFPLTHEALGLMLGVRRASVSAAAECLQGAGLIRYCHGQMMITDRIALERAACECYAATKQEFEALLRSPRHGG